MKRRKWIIRFIGVVVLMAVAVAAPAGQTVPRKPVRRTPAPTVVPTEVPTPTPTSIPKPSAYERMLEKLAAEKAELKSCLDAALEVTMKEMRMRLDNIRRGIRNDPMDTSGPCPERFAAIRQIELWLTINDAPPGVEQFGAESPVTPTPTSTPAGTVRP